MKKSYLKTKFNLSPQISIIFNVVQTFIFRSFVKYDTMTASKQGEIVE